MQSGILVIAASNYTEPKLRFKESVKESVWSEHQNRHQETEFKASWVTMGQSLSLSSRKMAKASHF